jgi:hypothetical protein
MPHAIPPTLADWLDGWRVSKNGNPVRLVGPDVYVVFPAQGRPPGYLCRVGRTLLEARWPDVETAKARLYEHLLELSPAELAELHGPPQADRPEPRREPQGAPPTDDGELLAELPRGLDEVLRVTLREYEGRPFVSLRVWALGQSGGYWPVKGKGCTVRIREAEAVAGALRRAAALADPGRGVAERGASGRGGWSSSLPPLRSSAPFDEFDDEGAN